MSPLKNRRLIIVGGGHASLPLVKMGEKWKSLGLEIILISENPYLIYSGALPQFIAGFYDWEQTAVNLVKLCNRYAVTFIEKRVKSIDKERARVTVSGGDHYDYDSLLINLGAETAAFTSVSNAVPVKPMDQLLSLREQLQDGNISKLLIAGGGAAGSELALNLSHPNSTAHPEITILDKNSRLLSGFPAKLSERVTSILKQRSVKVHVDTQFDPEMSKFYDASIIAVGNRPGSQAISHNFNTGAGGRILTDDKLRVVGEKFVFAAGDTADVDGCNYRPIGVHAVKQGIILRENINAMQTGGKLNSYKPYILNPLILSNGPDEAFYVLKEYVLNGRWAAILKHMLDMNWFEKYTELPENRKSYTELLHGGMKRSMRQRS